MKFLLTYSAITALAFGIASAEAKSVWDELNETAPRVVFEDLQDTAPRTVFDEIADTAPLQPREAEPADLVGE